MAQEQTAPLSVERIVPGAEGVEPFFWPVSRAEMVAFRDALLHRLLPMLDGAAAEGVPGARELRLLSIFWLSECMGLYQAVLLSRRLDASGRIPAYGPGFRLWEAVFQGRAPDGPPLFSVLANTKNGDAPRFKNPLRIFRKLCKARKKNPAASAPDSVCFSALPKQDLPRISSARPTRALLRDGVVTTKRSDIISMHAAVCDRNVGYLEHKHWFASVGSLPARVAVSRNLLEDVCDLVAATFEDSGERLPGYLRDYLLGGMERGCRLVGAHLARLDASPSGLPARLWTGSGGNIWDRMLRLAVRGSGGEVTGHDHALGDSYLLWEECFCLNEFFECDVFMTYTKRQRDLLAGQLDAWRRFSGHAPRIVSAPWPDGKDAASVFASFAPREQVRSVMLVGVFYIGEESRVYPLQSDVVAVDFQARLLARLREWGYEAIFKEHPESRARAPMEFESVIGAYNENRRFEQVVESADVILFSCLRTSTFNITMRSNKPAVFIDFGEDVFADSARSLLAGRCPIVPAGVAPDNRVQLDWDALRSAIAESVQLADDARFFKRYLLD
jgi:hypothetical protein